MRNIVLLILLTVMASTIHAKAPLEAYGKLASKSMMVISPNGKRIAYRDTSGDTDAMMIINYQSGELIAAVDLSNVNPNSAYFIDDERLIFVVSNNKRIANYRGRHIVSAAYVFNIESKELFQLLTGGKGIYDGQTSLGNIIGLSADKKYAFMPAYQNRGSFNLYKVNLEYSRKPTIYKKGKSDTIDFFLGEDAQVVARERYNNKTNLHTIESLIDGDWKEIFRQETPYRTKGFTGLTPDRKNLVMLSQNQEHGRWAYFTMALKDGEIKGPLFSHADKDVEYVLKDINRVVHGVQYSGFLPSYEFFDKKINARMRGLKQALPNNNIQISDYTPDWKTMVLYMDGEGSSGDYILYKDSALGMLTSSRPGIKPEQVNQVSQHEFKARDGLTIPTLITTPVNRKANKLPAIMLPHGGPASYDKIGFDWLAQYFSNQGYIVIQPQFRGSKGFGPKHLRAGNGEWGRKMQHDLTDAVNHFAEQGMIDKDRVCIVGLSYGGYAALAGASFTPDLYQCAISINGVSDVEQMLDTEIRDYGSDHWVVSYWQDVISKGDVDDDHLEQISPVNHAKSVKAPILLIHGELDTIVPLEQSEDMYDELKSANKDVTFIELEDGNHHLSNAKNRTKALKEIDKFIKKHI